MLSHICIHRNIEIYIAPNTILGRCNQEPAKVQPIHVKLIDLFQGRGFLSLKPQARREAILPRWRSRNSGIHVHFGCSCLSNCKQDAQGAALLKITIAQLYQEAACIITCLKKRHIPMFQNLITSVHMSDLSVQTGPMLVV